MSLRDILALYGPNRPHWEPSTYVRLRRSGVRRVVWRTDSDVVAPHQLHNLGVDVVAQAPDRFGDRAYTDPTNAVGDAWTVVSRTCWPGTPVVLDNEPQRRSDRAGQWYAEQYTRYLRAVHARWRWIDHEGHYPLVTPGLATGPDRNGRTWHQVGSENLLEAAGIGLHAYWEDSPSADAPEFGCPWELLPPAGDGKPLWILEFGNTRRGFTHEDHLPEYERWLRRLPDTVQLAALFLLDGTTDWPQYEISDRVLDWLANLRD